MLMLLLPLPTLIFNRTVKLSVSCMRYFTMVILDTLLLLEVLGPVITPCSKVIDTRSDGDRILDDFSLLCFELPIILSQEV